jgi:hypothetical protein
MKKIVFTLFFCGIAFIAKSQNQDVSVEKSTYGIQIGTLGIWVHNEAKLSDQIALRSEFGLDSGIFGGNFYPKTGYLLTPVITLEPKWYYNLQQRSAKSKDFSGNSGNFVSLKTSYNPDWFVISNYDNLKIVNQISIIPTWGIRRNIGNHFNYETGIGLGFRYYFAKSAGYLKDVSETALNLHLRIGYKF